MRPERHLITSVGALNEWHCLIIGFKNTCLSAFRRAFGPVVDVAKGACAAGARCQKEDPILSLDGTSVRLRDSAWIEGSTDFHSLPRTLQSDEIVESGDGHGW